MGNFFSLRYCCVGNETRARTFRSAHVAAAKRRRTRPNASSVAVFSVDPNERDAGSLRYEI